MTRIVGRRLVITPEPHSECAECHHVAECRPYGENGAKICFDCAMKPENEARTKKAMDALIDQVDEAVYAPVQGLQELLDEEIAADEAKKKAQPE